jgi:hypothetical protein
MSVLEQWWLYLSIRMGLPVTPIRDRGEVSATTIVMAAALIALALAVGAIITSRVTSKANSLDLG